MTRDRRPARTSGAPRVPSRIWLKAMKELRRPDPWEWFIRLIEVILALVAIVIAYKLGREANKMGVASLEWQRQTYALQRATLKVERTLIYKGEDIVAGTLKIQNHGPARALSVIIRIESAVRLAESPAFKLGPRHESMPLDEEGTLVRYDEVGDLERWEWATVELELEASRIATRNANLGFYPFDNWVDCENCDETEYVDTKLEDFPPLPSGRIHIVQPGETLTDILEPYGLKPWDLEWWNPDLDPLEELHEGQILIIPPPVDWPG